MATLGAIAFNSVAGTIDAKFTVITTLLGWAALLVYAYAFIETQSQVWIWAFLNEPVYVLQDDPHW